MKNKLTNLIFAASLLLVAALPFAGGQTPAPSTPAPATPIPLVTPKPVATPAPLLNLTAKLPAATVQAAMAALSQFVTLPSGVTPAQIHSITIFLGKDGSALVRVQ